MKKIIFYLQFILITSITFANTIDLFTPDDYIIEAASLGESMSDEEFMYFAFAFSDIPTNRIPSYMQKYTALATKLSREISSLQLNAFDKGEYILAFLHEHQFKTYRETITKLNNLFNSGIYNCVSSSVLYYALAMRNGLQVHGVKTFDHVFCAISINRQITDIETTSPYGFNPGEKKEFQNSFGQTGFVYTPPSNYADRTNIGKIGLLSLIIQNNIVELYKTERFEDVVPLAVNLHSLLQSNGSYNAMVGEFSNYATYLSKHKRFSDGIDFFVAATDHYGSNPKFNELAGALFNNALVSYLSYRSVFELKINLEKATTFFNNYKNESIVPADIIALSQKNLDEATIRVFVENNTFNMSVIEIKKYYNENRIDKIMHNDLLMYVSSVEVNLLMDKKKWVESLQIATQAVLDTENDYRAKTQLQTVEYNIGAFYHNEFASLFNKKQFIEAEKKIHEGLQIVPNNKTLQNDAKTIQDYL